MGGRGLIFIDASAIVAMITREPDHAEIRLRMDRDSDRWTSAFAVLEASLAVARKFDWPLLDAKGYVDRLLGFASIHIHPVGAREGDLAVEAYARFGKGLHPARLNIGDCFSYACARSLGSKLLFKGEDFTKTDALPA